MKQWLARIWMKPATAVQYLLVLLGCAIGGQVLAQANVTGITAPSGHYYGAGQAVPITLTFDSAVTVTGSPTLSLNAGATPAACQAVTNSTTVSCVYTVASGDSAAPLASVALALNSGTITTVSGGLAASLSLAGVTTALSASNVTIDTTAPTLNAAMAVNNVPSGSNTITLTFSEPMSNNVALAAIGSYTVTDNSNTTTFALASATPGAVVGGGVSTVTLTLVAPDPNNASSYITNAEIAAHIRVTPSASLTDLAGNAIANTVVVEAGATHTTDSTPPTLPANRIKANNSVQPNTITLTFSEVLANTAAVTDTTKYTVTNNGGTITYTVASAAQTSPGVVILTLAAATPGTTTSYMTNADIAAHIKVALAAGFADLAGNALVAATITDSGALDVTDSVAPTVVSTLTYIDSTHVKVAFSEKVNQTSAQTASNYTISGTGGMSTLSGAASSAVLGSDGLSVTLTVASLAAMKAGDTVKITVAAGVTDLAGRSLGTAGVATFAAVGAPAAFTFTPVTNVQVKTAIVSNSVTITGISIPTTLSVVANSDSSLQCAITPAATGVAGSFGACNPTTPITINNGDQIKLQLTSAALGGTTVSGGISIGGVSASFSVTTAQSLVVAGLTYTALGALTSAFNTVDPAIMLSANGIVVVPSTVTSSMSILPAAPVNTAISLKAGGNYSFTLGGLAMNVQPVGGDATVTTKSYSVDGAAASNLLEMATGRALITYSGSALPVVSVSLGSSTAQMLISSVGSGPLTVDVQRNADGTAVIGVVAGQISLRLPSKVSTLVTTDVATPYYKSEVVTLTAAAKVASVRVGSIAGNTAGVLGDALPTSILPAGVKSRVKLPDLGGVSDRADPTKPLLQSLFDFIGSRTTITQSTQGVSGQIPMLWDGVPLYLTPYGDVQVDTTRTDGIILTSDGHFEVSRNGVYVKLTTTANSLASFAQAVQGSYVNGTVTLAEDGAFEVANNGKTMLMKPDLVAQSTGGSSTLLTQNSDSQVVFQGAGLAQTMYPHLYDLTQLAGILTAIDPKVTLRDNLNGTVTMTLNGTATVLVPRYEVLSPIGGVPPEHRADPFWVADGVVYFKYKNGSAQGFSVQ